MIAKICTHKFQCIKADKVLQRLHKPLCRILTASCVLHFLSVIPVFRTRNLFIYITGLGIILFFALLVFFYHLQRRKAAEWLRWHRALASLMFLCVVGHIAIYYIDFCDYQSRISDIQLQRIDAGSIADGNYIGEYDAGYIYAKVQVQISDGAIRDIILLRHGNERGQAAENVIPNIVDTQAFPVDAVTGAANSSKVIQKAVQNALEGAQP